MSWVELAELLNEWAVQTLWRADGTRVPQAYLHDLLTPELEREADEWLEKILSQPQLQIPPDHLRYPILPRLRYAAVEARLAASAEAQSGFVPMKVSATKELRRLLIEYWHSTNRTAWMHEDTPDDFSFPN